MKKRMTTGFVAWVVVLCIGLMQIPAFAEGQHYMYSRYDGAAIMVENGTEAAFSQGYANPDETITVYSRVDGAPAVIWSYEVAENQEYYATGLQNIRMYSRYDGAMILVHSYEAAGYSANYYGEKATVTIYSTIDGAAYTVWASELAAYLNVGYSTAKPYIPVYAYAGFADVPSFGSLVGQSDNAVYADLGIYYYYILPTDGWETVNRYTNELKQWGYWYYMTSSGIDIYYNGTHFVGIGYSGNVVGIGIMY
ncbi:MAG: hypothetical protein HFI90_05465 [Clostridia bacterium]|nr:hypothetical protein [Clostridia bacterium]